MKNRLVAIGYLGGFICYLNLSREQAIQRYLTDNEYMCQEITKLSIKEFDFTDRFEAYDVDLFR